MVQLLLHILCLCTFPCLEVKIRGCVMRPFSCTVAQSETLYCLQESFGSKEGAALTKQDVSHNQELAV